MEGVQNPGSVLAPNNPKNGMSMNDQNDISPHVSRYHLLSYLHTILD